jgi:acyl-homoserine-lactone acylase
MRSRFLAVLAVAAAGMCFPASAAASYNVSLTRTTGGVANVSGESFADVGFGIGYAQAQDGICLLAETFLTVEGERSAFLGPEGVFKNEAEGGLQFTNLNSDLYWTSIRDARTVQKLLRLPYPQGPSTEGREVVRGYAAGYNAYLRHIGGASGVTNPACKGAAWVRAIKPIDVWLRIYQVDDLAGNSALGPYVEANAEYGPPADPSAESAKRQGARTASIGSISIGKLALVGHSNLLGSNGLAIGSEDATNGGGVVLANPHFPWHGAERFWEMNVEIPGNLGVARDQHRSQPGRRVDAHRLDEHDGHAVGPAARGTDQVLLQGQSAKDDDPHREDQSSGTRQTGAAHRHPLLQPLWAGDLGGRSRGRGR